MPRFMVLASYTAEGVRGVVSEGGSSRRQAVMEVAESLGGRIESFYFAFGEDDVLTILELPDNASAAAVAMTVAATGLVNTRMIPLLTPEEVDAAAKKSVGYRAPGQ